MKNFYEFLESLQSHGGASITPGWSFLNMKQDLYANKKQVTANKNYFKKFAKSKIIPKLVEVLNRNTDYPIHIYFGIKNDAKKIVRTQDITEINILKKLYMDYFFNIQKIPPQDIVYVKQVSGGDVWKPWIIIHGLGHALFRYAKQYLSKIQGMYSNFLDIFIPYPEIIDYILAPARFYPDHDRVIMYLHKNPNFKNVEELPNFLLLRNMFLSNIFRFRSAKTFDISMHSYMPLDRSFAPLINKEEFVYEVFTWFMFNGCKLPRVDEEHIEQISNFSEKYHVEPINRGVIKTSINALLSDIEALFHDLLQKSRGKVLID